MWALALGVIRLTSSDERSTGAGAAMALLANAKAAKRVTFMAIQSLQSFPGMSL